MTFTPSMKNVAIQVIPVVALILSLTFGMASCSMVNEDLDPCSPPPELITKVNFEYTYNTSGTETGLYADWFNEHAGSAYLYVFDAEGVFLFKREKHKKDMNPNNIDFSIEFDETEIVPGKKYMMVGMAQGNHIGYEASLETPGFTLQHEMVEGVSKITDYRLKLDRNDDGTYDFGVFSYKDQYGNNQEMLDTVWCTKPNSVQTVTIPYITYEPRVEPYPPVYNKVTIPMMRITNSIKVNLVHESFSENTDADAYNIIIDFPHGNGTIGFTGETYNAQRLLYTSLRKQIKEYTPKDEGEEYEPAASRYYNTRAPEYCIYAEFGVSRLQVADDSSLKVYEAGNQEPIFTIDNFSEWLANYFSHKYDDDQEFLDREYDFTVDIHMDTQSRVTWVQVGVSVLGWGKRKQYEYW